MSKLTQEEKVKILDQHDRFIRLLVRKYASFIRNVEDLEDLHQIGRIAFYKALDTYDEPKSLPRTYAGKKAKWEIIKACTKLHRWLKFEGGEAVENLGYRDDRIGDRLEYYRWLIAQIRSACEQHIEGEQARVYALAILDNGIDYKIPGISRQRKAQVLDKIRTVCRENGIYYVGDRRW